MMTIEQNEISIHVNSWTSFDNIHNEIYFLASDTVLQVHVTLPFLCSAQTFPVQLIFEICHVNTSRT